MGKIQKACIDMVSPSLVYLQGEPSFIEMTKNISDSRNGLEYAM